MVAVVDIEASDEAHEGIAHNAGTPGEITDEVHHCSKGVSPKPRLSPRDKGFE
jgi:hypothetical protein